MKIAVSSQGSTLESPVDSRFGRAAGFIVYDTDEGGFTHAGNEQNLNLAQGAGIQAAMNVANTGAKAVITGHVGPKAYMALEKGNIEVYLVTEGTVAQALDAHKAGKLQKISGPDVEGHW